ncbi:MAG: TolC family protein [Leptospiraceae bacterium]|nr:TolC family protein [Leptospiraceae bacterium]
MNSRISELGFAFCFAITHLLCTETVVSQPDSGSALTLREVENLVIEHSVELKEARIEQRIAREKEAMEFRNLFPSLSISYRQNRTVARRNFDNGRYSVQVKLSQPVYDGGRSSLRRKIARIQTQMARDRRSLLRRKTAHEARKSYLAMQGALARLSLAHSRRLRSERLLESARLEYRNGLITRLDFLEIQNQHRRSELKIHSARRSAEKSRRELILLTGLSKEAFPGIRLLDMSNTVFRAMTFSPDRLAELTRKNHPRILRLQRNLYRARENYKVSKEYYLPTISLTGRYGKTGDQWPPGQSEWGLGVNITFRGLESTLSQNVGLDQSRNGASRGVASGGQLQVLNDTGVDARRLRATSSLLKARRALQDLKKALPLEARMLARQYRDRRLELRTTEHAFRIQKKRFKIDALRYRKGQLALEEYNEEEQRLHQSSLSRIQKRIQLLQFISQMELDLGIPHNGLRLVSIRYLPDLESRTLSEPGQSL